MILPERPQGLEAALSAHSQLPPDFTLEIVAYAGVYCNRRLPSLSFSFCLSLQFLSLSQSACRRLSFAAAVGDYISPSQYEVITAWCANGYRSLGLATSLYSALSVELHERRDGCRLITCDVLEGSSIPSLSLSFEDFFVLVRYFIAQLCQVHLLGFSPPLYRFGSSTSCASTNSLFSIDRSPTKSRQSPAVVASSSRVYPSRYDACICAKVVHACTSTCHLVMSPRFP